MIRTILVTAAATATGIWTALASLAGVIREHRRLSASGELDRRVDARRRRRVRVAVEHAVPADSRAGTWRTERTREPGLLSSARARMPRERRDELDGRDVQGAGWDGDAASPTRPIATVFALVGVIATLLPLVRPLGDASLPLAALGATFVAAAWLLGRDASTGE